eukprot:PhF_6_TR36184/c1_g1_i3/m.52724
MCSFLTSATTVAFVAVLLLHVAQAMTSTVSSSSDPCALHYNCSSCAAINSCGWCSEPVTYPDGTHGPNCAGPSSSSPFTCNGIYSTNQCLQGYVCDQGSGACRLAAPGQGVPFDKCNAACTVGPSAQVYGCLNGSTSCVVVPPGTPGSGSREQCEITCVQPPAVVYKCDNVTKQCVVVPSGTPGSASKEVCEAVGCDSGNYRCDLKTLQCVQGGGTMSQSYCTSNCRAPNDPCSQYKNCSTCLSGHPQCGWCGVDVTYDSGLKGGQCAGVSPTTLPFQCPSSYSTKQCSGPTPPPTPTPQPTASPVLPPQVDCPKGSMVLLQYNCANQNCNGCNTGTAAMCVEPHCTYYCSGKCQPVPAFSTSFMWSCNGDLKKNTWTNATLVHFLKAVDCTGPVNPPGTGGSGTYPLEECGSPYGPNNPPQYNTFMCVPCGASC